MRKSVDFKGTESYAKMVTSESLNGAYFDAVETAMIWDKVPAEQDPDGNAGFYHDQASCYFKELKRRAESVDKMTKKAEANPTDANCETLRQALAAKRMIAKYLS